MATTGNGNASPVKTNPSDPLPPADTNTHGGHNEHVHTNWTNTYTDCTRTYTHLTLGSL